MLNIWLTVAFSSVWKCWIICVTLFGRYEWQWETVKEIGCIIKQLLIFIYRSFPSFSGVKCILMVNLLIFQIVHRTLAAMLGSLAALAALAVIGDVSHFYS